MPSESGDKWGWEHVSVFGGFDKGSGTKRWKCNHCYMCYNGSYSRVRAHLLGFSGVGVKSCPAIGRSMREAFQILEEEHLDQKRIKNASGSSGKPGKRVRASQSTPTLKAISKEDVDDKVTRFCFAAGLSVEVINTCYFLDMVKAIGAYGSDYESPSVDTLTDSLNREKLRLGKSVSLVRESWPHTGCSILCVGSLDGGLGSLHASLFVSSPRGLVFLKAVDLNGSDGVFGSALRDAIEEVGHANIVQIISDIGDACKSNESCISSEFPSILWSPCTRRSMLVLMEEIAELEWVKPIISCGKSIERCMMGYQDKSTSSKFSNLKYEWGPISCKLAPSYCFLQAMFEVRQTLQEVVTSEEWRQWKHSSGQDVSEIESSISGDDLWGKVHLLLELYEPFVQVITTLEKSLPGDICHWRIQTLEALRGKAIDDDLLNQLEFLIDTRWDTLFSPLHGAGYVLSPRFIGKWQSKDKHVMRGWKAVLERYQCDSNGRRILREQLSSFWRLEGSLGEEDAVDCRDKLEPVAWWENFGFEMPELQTLAIRVLGQVSSVGICHEMCQKYSSCSSYQEVGSRMGVQKADDLLFVRNNLRLQSQRMVGLAPSEVRTYGGGHMPDSVIHDTH